MKTTENKGFLTSPNAMGRSVAVKLPVAFQKANKINGFEHIFYGTALYFSHQFLLQMRSARNRLVLIRLPRNRPILVVNMNNDGLGAALDDCLHGAVRSRGHGNIFSQRLGADRRFHRHHHHAKRCGPAGGHFPQVECGDIGSCRFHRCGPKKRDDATGKCENGAVKYISVVALFISVTAEVETSGADFIDHRLCLHRQ